MNEKLHDVVCLGVIIFGYHKGTRLAARSSAANGTNCIMKIVATASIYIPVVTSVIAIRSYRSPVQGTAVSSFHTLSATSVSNDFI